MVTTGGRRVGVVTGGTAGVGRAAVREFARRGYDVAILARGAAGLEGAAADGEDPQLWLSVHRRAVLAGAVAAAAAAAVAVLRR
jgi:short-subunit dehydrogenase